MTADERNDCEVSESGRMRVQNHAFSPFKEGLSAIRCAWSTTEWLFHSLRFSWGKEGGEVVAGLGGFMCPCEKWVQAHWPRRVGVA